MPVEKQIQRTPDDINILLADSFIKHADGKISALGLFQVIHVSDLPAVHRSMALIVELSCGMGPQPWALKVVDPKASERFAVRGTANLRKYADKFNIVVMVHDLKIESQGEWRVEFLLEGEPVKTRKFFVQQVPRQGTGAPGGFSVEGGLEA